ncbi:MAG: Fic family protein [Spirulina sp. SIO3F2]|nr:Fic family protein [Spirulina sp. SIO3F2]
MQRDRFTENAPGELRQVTLGRQTDWAFIPHPLPPAWENPPSTWSLLTQAKEALGRLDGVGRYMPNYNLLLRPLQRREALRSSSLEGTYATPEQLLLFELDPQQPQSVSDPVNAWQEVANYTKALELGLHLLESRPLSLNLIREMHRTLLMGVRGAQANPGHFRRGLVKIGSNARFIPPPAPEVLPCLDRLEKFIHQPSTIDPLLLCFMVHYQFESIHPFIDGNGRVGRLLLSLMIYQKCQLDHPWLYLSAFFDRYKDEYIDNLFAVSATGNWEAWLNFCLRGVIDQSQDSIQRFDALLQLRNQYLERLSQQGGNIRLNRLIDYLFESPAITRSQLAELCDVSYPTATQDLERLIQANILVEADWSQRPKIYFAPEIMVIAYQDN